MTSAIASGSAGVLPPTNIASYAVSGFGASYNWFTVPAGYTFYCTSISLGLTSAGTIGLQVSAVDKILIRVDANQTGSVTGSAASPLFTIAAGDTATLVQTVGGAAGIASISGFLQ